MRNIAIGTKLTLLVLILPIAVLVIVDILGFYLYGTLTIEISNFLSSVLVFLLVWERLRESISTKMKYLHENYIYGFYKTLKWHCVDTHTKGYFEHSEEIKELRKNLSKYARFLRIKLYPAKLPQKLDEFLQKQEAFTAKTQVFIEIGNKHSGNQYELWTLLKYLGLEVSHPPLDKQLDIITYQELVLEIKKQHQNVIDEAMNILNSLKRLRESMLQELEDFLKCNDLKVRERASDSF